MTLSTHVLPVRGSSTAPGTSVRFDGWVRGPRASGTSRIQGLPSQVLRDQGRLYTLVTPQYLATAVGQRANQSLLNRWLVSDPGPAASLSGAMTWPEILRLLPADASVKEDGVALLDGREVSRLRYETSSGTKVSLWVAGTSPAQVEAESPSGSTVTVRFARLGGAPRLSLPKDVADPFGVLR